MRGGRILASFLPLAPPNHMIPADITHIEVVEAMRAEHREEVAKLHMRIVAYRQLLEEHGIEPPDHTDDDLLALWQDSRAVISTASHFVARLGTAKELL